MCWESAIPVSSSRAKSSIFLAHRYSAVCVIAEKGKTFAKGARKSRVQGRFLAALEMTVWENGFISRSVQWICLENAIPQRHPERSPRSFLHTGIASYVWQSKIGSLPRKGQGRTECKEDFSTALEMTAWGWVTHVPYKGYVGKTPLPQRHPERSQGIFLAYRYSAVCVIAEKGKPFAKGARKSRVQGRFLATLEMTVWENGFISRSVQRICLENAISATSSRAKPSIFFVGGKTESVWERETGNIVSRKGGAFCKRFCAGGRERGLAAWNEGGYPLKSTKIWNCTPFLFTIVIK